jgi:predicted RNA-binding protein (virulence factor B family)
VFHVSKGKFKQTIGNLYRSHDIEIRDDGIRRTGSGS